MNRSELIDIIKDILADPHISDLAIDSFIQITEENCNRRLRVQDMALCATERTIAGKSNYSLPGDYLELTSISYNCAPVRFIPEDIFVKQYTNGIPSSDDRCYTISGGAIRILPVPVVDGDMIEINYYNRIPPLKLDTENNWLLSKHPSIYTSGCLAQACIYLQDDERIAIFDAQFNSAIEELILSDWNQMHSGSQLNYV